MFPLEGSNDNGGEKDGQYRGWLDVILSDSVWPTLHFIFMFSSPDAYAFWTFCLQVFNCRIIPVQYLDGCETSNRPHAVGCFVACKTSTEGNRNSDPSIIILTFRISTNYYKLYRAVQIHYKLLICMAKQVFVSPTWLYYYWSCNGLSKIHYAYFICMAK